jgi:hypothetical protein
MEAAVGGRDEMPWLSESSSSDALRALCSALSFSLASIACSFNCNVSSSSSSSSCCGAPRDMGRRFEGDGDTEVRSRCCSYLRRPDGELKSASTGDCGGQLGWFVLTTSCQSSRAEAQRSACIPFDFGLSLTIMFAWCKWVGNS